MSLQQARNNWLKNSQVLEEIKNTTIGKKLNLDPDIVATKPEDIAKALMRMDKTEAAQNINFLKRYDPASVGVVKRSYFDQALTDAGKPIDVSVSD